MQNSLRFAAPLTNVFFTKNSAILKQIGLILFGVFVLAFASQLSIPLVPVPLTFQSATVVLIGMTFGSKRGLAVILTYLVAGASGLPVFADYSAGLIKFMGPTGGYLLGFIPAVAVTGFLAERGFAKNIALSFVAGLIGAVLIFACGLTVLASFTGWHQALIYGLLPFIISEPIKLLAAACVAPSCWK